MTSRPSRELLRSLALAAGAPGHEHEVRDIVRKSIGELGTISHDALGSILCECPGTSAEPRVVLDCHLDEVGFIVQSITRDGRLKFHPLGGWWSHVLLAQRVHVITDGGGKVPGVISSKPPHFLRSEERRQVLPIEQLYIDVGARAAEEVRASGIQVGDSVVPASEFQEFWNADILSCKAFDNRVGVGLMCEALQALSGSGHPNTIIGVGAVQEEVGCRGAATASVLARPDVAIVLEGTPADDLPEIAERQGVMGKGPQIRIMDPTAISNRKLVRFVQRVAADEGIDIQLAVRTSGGTNARSIHLHGHGVPTVVIGVPARYIHTHVSLIDWQDYCASLELLVALVPRMDADTVQGFTTY